VQECLLNNVLSRDARAFRQAVPGKITEFLNVFLCDFGQARFSELSHLSSVTVRFHEFLFGGNSLALPFASGIRRADNLDFFTLRPSRFFDIDPSVVLMLRAKGLPYGFIASSIKPLKLFAF
jgi:hypothetical protein